jgi:hypothetical protein
LTNQTNSNSTCTVFDLEVPSLIGQLKIWPLMWPYMRCS